MTKLLRKIESWESAWAEYVEALKTIDETRPFRFTRGRRREWNNAWTKKRNAERKLRKIDPEFCDRMGIKAE